MRTRAILAVLGGVVVSVGLAVGVAAYQPPPGAPKYPPPSPGTTMCCR